MNTNKEINPVLRSRLRERFFIFIVNNFSAGFLDMETKICTKCKNEKTLDDFYKDINKKDGHSCACKECGNNEKREYRKKYPERQKEADKKYRAKNLEKRRIAHREWYKENKDYCKKYIKGWYKNNPGKMAIYDKTWRDKNIEYIREYSKNWHKEKRKTDISFRLNRNMACAVRSSLKGNKKGRHWEIIIGYTLKDLEAHLKSTLPKGYIWSDYLDCKLHLDHIIPLSIFNIKNANSKGFKKAWLLENLRLIPAKENLRKNNKLFYNE